ncbi:hypothetical protein KUTeg_012243, partial [Tegillarca granosa]
MDDDSLSGSDISLQDEGESTDSDWEDVLPSTAHPRIWVFVNDPQNYSHPHHFHDFREQSTSWLFHTPSFGTVMKRNRFQLILKYLHCNDNSTAVRRGVNGHDPAHKIRPILDLVNQRFKECYNLARDLTVDESIVGFKGRQNIVQYLPGKKTHRWGAKLFILAESETGYTSHIKVYA